MIELDCSYGEGGGQILRTALALSTITLKPFHAFGIRKNRPEPGLKAQHLCAIEALKQLCNAEAKGAELGSSEVTYIPAKTKGGEFSFDIGTAGSISLFLQAILPPLLFAPKKVKLIIIGGTCGKWQAPVEYFQNVLLPYLGAEVKCVIRKRGYYPKGGGIVEIEVKPCEIKKLNKTEQGELVQIKGISHASSMLQGVADRQAQSAKMELNKLSVPTQISIEYNETLSPGSGITLWAKFNKNNEPWCILGTDELGEKGVRAEEVGKIAAGKLINEIKSGVAVDSYMVDQILPFMALACPSSVKFSTLSEHAKANICVIEKFLDVKFEVKGNILSCK